MTTEAVDAIAAEMREEESRMKARHEAGALTDMEFTEAVMGLARSYASRMRRAMEEPPA